MIRDKDEFYDLLWNDYISLPEKERNKCFVYCYLKKKKDNRAEIIGRTREAVIEYSQRIKPDKYTLLKSAYIAAVKHGVITYEEYGDIFKGLIKRKQKGKDEYSIPGKYEKLCGEELTENAQEMFEAQFLRGCVIDFFNNSGYRTNRNVEHGKSEKLPKKNRRKESYNDDFEMLYEYSLFSGRDMQTADIVNTGALDDRYIEKCGSLYEKMLKDKSIDAFVPLFIDERTGAGIYIIGKGRLGDDIEISGSSDKRDCCYVCVIYFSDVDMLSAEDISLYMSAKKIFRSVNEAFDYFSALQRKQEFYENYPEANNCRLPHKDIDEEFMLYFVSGEDKEKLRRNKILESFRAKEAEEIRKIEEREEKRQKSRLYKS